MRIRGLAAMVVVGLLAGCSGAPDQVGSPSPAGSLSSNSAVGSTTSTTTHAGPTGPAGPTRSSGATRSESGPGPGSALGPVGVAGVNEAGCTSSRPPVVLLHGTLSSIAVDFPVLVPGLLDAGFCVYGADYGRGGTGSVEDSATFFADVVATVRGISGADRVDVVGFSQGGLVLRTALRRNDLSGQVEVAALISPSFHGTTSPLVGALPAGLCPACADQAAGSPLLTELAAGGDLDGAVRYAVAVTSSDLIVTPWPSQIPEGPTSRVRSVVLDEQCPGIVIRHQDMARTPAVVDWVAAALLGDGDVQPTDLRCSP